MTADIEKNSEATTRTHKMNAVWWLLIGFGAGSLIFWIIVAALQLSWMSFLLNYVVIFGGLMVLLLFFSIAYKSNKSEKQKKVVKIIGFLLVGMYLGFIINYNVVFIIFFS